MRLCDQTQPNYSHLANEVKKKKKSPNNYNQTKLTKPQKTSNPQNFSHPWFPELKYLTLQLESSFTVFMCVWWEGCYINIDYSINTLNTVKQMQFYAKLSLTECFCSSHKT